MNSPNIQTIIFDFGNVVGLFSYEPTWQKIRPHTDLSIDRIKQAIDETDLEEEYESGRISSDEFVRRMQAICQWRCPDDLFRSAWSEIFTPNEEICGLIPQLASRYQLLLGSNTNELHANHFRRQFADVLAHFDGLVLSHEIGARKPKHQFFHECAQRAHGEAQQCVFIDDLVANTQGAAECGMHGIIYRDTNDLTTRLGNLGVQIS